MSHRRPPPPGPPRAPWTPSSLRGPASPPTRLPKPDRPRQPPTLLRRGRDPAPSPAAAPTSPGLCFADTTVRSAPGRFNRTGNVATAHQLVIGKGPVAARRVALPLGEA